MMWGFHDLYYSPYRAMGNDVGGACGLGGH
jgi:hypothetical protein